MSSRRVKHEGMISPAPSSNVKQGLAPRAHEQLSARTPDVERGAGHSECTDGCATSLYFLASEPAPSQACATRLGDGRDFMRKSMCCWNVCGCSMQHTRHTRFNMNIPVPPAAPCRAPCSRGPYPRCHPHCSACRSRGTSGPQLPAHTAPARPHHPVGTAMTLTGRRSAPNWHMV